MVFSVYGSFAHISNDAENIKLKLGRNSYPPDSSCGWNETFPLSKLISESFQDFSSSSSSFTSTFSGSTAASVFIGIRRRMNGWTPT